MTNSPRLNSGAEDLYCQPLTGVTFKLPGPTIRYKRLRFGLKWVWIAEALGRTTQAQAGLATSSESLAGSCDADHWQSGTASRGPSQTRRKHAGPRQGPRSRPGPGPFLSENLNSVVTCQPDRSSSDSPSRRDCLKFCGQPASAI